jgi:hypothetical protein
MYDIDNNTMVIPTGIITYYHGRVLPGTRVRTRVEYHDRVLPLVAS